MRNILMINGPNLNLLGKRDNDIYGNKTLNEIENLCIEKCKDLNYKLETFSSNSEGSIIDKLQMSDEKFDYVILNAGAFSHYSIAIRDTVESINTPVIEVHISNIYARESFRHSSVISSVAKGSISGFGYKTYLIAIDAINEILKI